jgi:polysaccharide biosynthesis protein PslJ
MDFGEHLAGPIPLRGSQASGGGHRVLTSRATALLTWPNAAILLVVVIWLIPIKSYRFPVALPFNLEPYRILILALMFAWVVSALLGNARLSSAGQTAPIVVLAGAGIAALVANRDAIDAAAIQGQAVKSLSFFLSYLVVYLLLTSTLSSIREVEVVIKALVIGAALVGLASLYEARTGYNLFNHLHGIFPFLEHTRVEGQNFAGGQLRARASAQHPIALGAALTLCIPLAVYLARKASTRGRAGLWLCAAGVMSMGALSTKSRTVVLMLLAMLIVAGIVFGPKALLRRWPLVLMLIAVTHFASPGAVSHLYKRFNPKGGLVGQQQVRAGETGSGRLADLGPGLERWVGSPLFGRGLGTVAATGGQADARNGQVTTSIIFDDQYMNTLVSLGALGFLGVFWFVWGSVRKLSRSARRLAGREKELIGALAISCAGFGAAMLTYDAFSFVQSTLVFFIIAALGLRARALLTP